jgi:hypothetical protein
VLSRTLWIGDLDKSVTTLTQEFNSRNCVVEGLSINTQRWNGFVKLQTRQHAESLLHGSRIYVNGMAIRVSIKTSPIILN